MGQIFQQWDAPLMQWSSLSFASIANQTVDICVCVRHDDSALFPFLTNLRTSFYNSSGGPPGGLDSPTLMTLADMKGVLQKTCPSSVTDGTSEYPADVCKYLSRNLWPKYSAQRWIGPQFEHICVREFLGPLTHFYVKTPLVVCLSYI